MTYRQQDILEGLIVFALLAAFITAAWFVASASNDEREAFMVECRKERKEYECKAMWRAGNSGTVVVPMVVPVGR